MVLGILGMHQLSTGHDMATGPTVPAASATVPTVGSGEHGRAGAMPAVAGHPDGPVDGRTTDGGLGGACPGCADHQMALGSCLLALSLLVLTWLLVPPRPRHVPPFLVSLLAPKLSSVAGRLVPPLSLAELSLLRT